MRNYTPVSTAHSGHPMSQECRVDYKALLAESEAITIVSSMKLIKTISWAGKLQGCSLSLQRLGCEVVSRLFWNVSVLKVECLGLTWSCDLMSYGNPW